MQLVFLCFSNEMPLFPIEATVGSYAFSNCGSTIKLDLRVVVAAVQALEIGDAIDPKCFFRFFSAASAIHG